MHYCIVPDHSLVFRGIFLVSSSSFHIFIVFNIFQQFCNFLVHFANCNGWDFLNSGPVGECNGELPELGLK